MDQAPALIESVASLVWPLALVALIVVLLPTLRRILGDSESVDVEVAGTKVSIQRASEGLRRLITDLQDRVNELESARIDVDQQIPKLDEGRQRNRSVLWVDDRLEANVYERARLRDANFQVVQAESTTKALNALETDGPFEVIISDMSRIESSGRLNTRAGLELLSQLRAAGDTTPVVFFSSSRSLAPVLAELNAQTGVSYTTSPSELMRLVGIVDS
ncbi:hypothetical protein ACWEOW_01890 [Monashia sp. NPDC004114]